jgi:hypothetical protein
MDREAVIADISHAIVVSVHLVAIGCVRTIVHIVQYAITVSIRITGIPFPIVIAVLLVRILHEWTIVSFAHCVGTEPVKGYFWHSILVYIWSALNIRVANVFPRTLTPKLSNSREDTFCCSGTCVVSSLAWISQNAPWALDWVPSIYGRNVSLFTFSTSVATVEVYTLHIWCTSGFKAALIDINACLPQKIDKEK